MRIGACLVLVCGATLSVPGLNASVSAQAVPLKTVLTITQGAETFPSNLILDASIREVLSSRADLPIDCFTEYLESDAFPDEAATLAFRNYITEKYHGRRIDVVIAITVSVLRFVLQYRAQLFPEAAIVFNGLAIPNGLVPGAGAGLTGIINKGAYSETLALALELQPSTRQVLVIAQQRDEQTVQAVRDEVRAAAPNVNVTFLTQDSIPALLAAVRATPPGSVILFVWWTHFEPGHVLYPDVIARLVAEAAPVPVYGAVDFYVGSGVVGGAVRSTRATGIRLAQMALEILSGKRAEDIPFETAPTTTILDWRQLRRWGISEARIPADAEIRFREVGVWQQYRPYVAAALVVLLAQSALISALLFQARRRRRAESRIRDLAGRLLGAQEAERSRIARELHDDISQQTTLLRLDLQGIRQHRPDPGDPVAALTRQAARRTESIARSLHELSHRLHPARLRLLGLVPSIQALCRESPPEVTVEFSHHSVPSAVHEDLALCLFRIAQEALQNSVKHGAAHHVSVDLGGSPKALTLEIVDDGIGFDADAASTTGLGLSSMRERAESLGGRLEVQSRPKAGTRIRVSVPVTPPIVQPAT